VNKQPIAAPATIAVVPASAFVRPTKRRGIRAPLERQAGPRRCTDAHLNSGWPSSATLSSATSCNPTVLVVGTSELGRESTMTFAITT
jgi:hypothetical protein